MAPPARRRIYIGTSPPRALISVYDKTGVVEFARGLAGLGAEIYSSGGTHRSLAQAGIPVRPVSDLTGFPEILDGRVKTLHPGVHAGILARRDQPDHLQQLADHGLRAIDVVAVNLYPFVETVRKPDVSLEEALENIDIGGPAMVRAAAKNFPHVIVLVDPADYNDALDALASGEAPLEWRRKLAVKAFQHVAAYDTAIAAYLRGFEDPFPPLITFAARKRLDLRYGENPHQLAAFYRLVDVFSARPQGIAAAEQLHGKELSYNNILDADAAWAAACDFEEPAVAVIKHTNPCGLAVHEDLAEAYRRAYSGDTVSAYGGIVAANRPVTAAMAEAMKGVFYEVVVAPGFEPEALERLRKRRDLRILQAPLLDLGRRVLTVRSVEGGFLMQEADRFGDITLETRTVTRRGPTDAEMRDLLFAWRAAKHVKSNAIVLARDRTLVGMGAGQPNRVTSVHLAVRAAAERAVGSVLASDAFFPFADGVRLAAEAGVTAIIQPGGSIRDEESIAAADEAGLAMVFTGVRHFKH